MGKLFDEVYLGTKEQFSAKLEMLAQMAQPENWSFGKDKVNDPYKILRNYFVHTYNRLSLEGKLPWHFNGFFKESNRQFTNYFPTIPEMANYFEDPSDLIFNKRPDIKMFKEHIIDDNYDRFCDAGYTEKGMIDLMLDSAKQTLYKKLHRNYKIALPFYYTNTVTNESKIQLLVPLYFPGAPVRLALVLNKVCNENTEYYEAVTVLPVEWAYMNSR